jgi:hypothetical protein
MAEYGARSLGFMQRASDERRFASQIYLQVFEISARIDDLGCLPAGHDRDIESHRQCLLLQIHHTDPETVAIG